jgi:hypothetical protein
LINPFFNFCSVLLRLKILDTVDNLCNLSQSGKSICTYKKSRP